RTWTYGYSVNNLVSVNDPLTRITTYQYSTGINSWLVSAVLYATGGKTTYRYAYAMVGTEVKTYYVTQRRVFSSSTSKSQIANISYNIVNGNVILSNSTVANAINQTQNYENYNLRSSDNLIKHYNNHAGASQ